VQAKHPVEYSGRNASSSFAREGMDESEEMKKTNALTASSQITPPPDVM
jgi:hypothetical protein